MSMPALNLATRPFRNERLPALLLALGFTVAGAVTVKHAFAIRALMPGRTSGLAREVQQLEDELSRLRAQTASMRAPRPDPEAVAHWTLLKELVDQRTFAWSGLFAVLERSLPRGVRLVSIAPSVEKGQTLVDLSAIARSNEDGLELITALEAQPEFEEVLPRARTGESERNFRLTLKYRPAPAPAAAASPAPPSPADSAAPASPGAAVPPSPVAVAATASPGAAPSGATGAAPRAGMARKDPEGVQ
jgi:Tfp pilus assembly protein PilN